MCLVPPSAGSPSAGTIEEKAFKPMRKALKRILKGELVNEKSIWWLLLKGFGGVIPISIAAIIALFAYKSYDISYSSRLAEEVTKLTKDNREKSTLVDSLRQQISKFEKDRFIMHKESTRQILSGVYLTFNGWHDVYEVNTIDSVLINEKNIPTEKPDIFSVGGKSYSIVSLERFKETVGGSDSVLFFLGMVE